jgi:hypothetical protein
MNALRQGTIRAEARKLLVQLWDKRKEFWSSPPSVEEVVRGAPGIVITEILGLTLEKPEEIPLGLASTVSPGPQFEIAGYIDRAARKIVVAQKFPLEWRRFTTAHEIGHWILHPEFVNHRDLPLMGGERANKSRPQKEREADLFAAEFLLPSKLLRKVFKSCFGGILDGSKPDHDLAFKLSAASGQRIGACDLAKMDPMLRALIVAAAGTFGARSFVPLHE